MSKQFIHQYYNQLDAQKKVGATNEMSIKRAFDKLIDHLAFSKNYIYVTEITIKNDTGKKNIRPDGVLKNQLNLEIGYIESKDTKDTLDEEINKKLYKDGYPKTNIIFQDGIETVLFQKGVEVSRILMNNADKLEKILNQFINFKSDDIEKFEEALAKFKEDIPVIVETLRTTINEKYSTNKKFSTASEDFFEMCQKEINPQITKEDIREMIIQHILTEDLFKSVFDESDFHHENNIANQLENLVNTFMNREVRQNQLGELGYYYKALNAQASKVADHHEKQKFLKVVYENFYKVYNPKGADKLGVVYTPNEIVRFMVQSTDYLLQKHFNKGLADKNVHILDPATGTGTFITDIIDYIPAQYLEHKYRHEIFANEVAILPYYVANLNIEYTYKQKMGTYLEFPNSCFVDTLDNIDGLKYEGKQHNIFGFSSENAERIKRQNDNKISVIIGNPPYNANQANFNDFNQNREYPSVDKRIKETYVKYSSAQKTKVYDMYARFYRWATDRLDDNGVLAFVTNRSFIDSRTFDGFRKIVSSEFNHIYIVDLGGDVRSNPKLSGPKNNVFAIQTGVAIMFLVRKDNLNIVEDFRKYLGYNQTREPEISMLSEPTTIYLTKGQKTKEEFDSSICRIQYYRRPEEELAAEKLEFLRYSKIENLAFEAIHPDRNNNWVNQYNNDFESLIPIADKKHKDVIFASHSNGVSTNRDEWVFDLDKKNLEKKAKFLSEKYNESTKVSVLDEQIKWSRDLKNKLNRNLKSIYNRKNITTLNYRPFAKQNYYSERIFSDVLTQNHFDYFGKNLDIDNKVICYNSNEKDFIVLASNKIIDLHFTGDTKIFAFNKFDTIGSKLDNITDWGLKQFINHYTQVIATPRNDASENTFNASENPFNAWVNTFNASENTFNASENTFNASENPFNASENPFNASENSFNASENTFNAWENTFNASSITKEDIFYYTYAVLHNPAYRKKYEMNLKREFPRLPFYDDFFQWVSWGKQLMDLHIDYETVAPFGLQVIDNSSIKDNNYKSKVKLKADKTNGIITLDEHTILLGIPDSAWQYKLGNRSALDWVLDQYKEKKYTDKTIAENFNTYRFADYKPQVIDLLQRVCTVSVETMKIIGAMQPFQGSKP